jgi:NAD(P)-dependent dehydrogenase (short-subunit alcohol dehydrogenase family)
MAKALARQGANIVLNGFGDVEGPKAEVEALGVKVAYHGADMSKPAEIEAMMAAAAEFGGVDILVNNAGIQHVANVEDFPVERWDAIIAINLSSAFHTTRLALPGMKARNWGRIINIASAHGLVAVCPEERLRGRQARHRRPDQGDGAGERHHRRHRQRHLPGLGADAAGAEAGRRPRRCQRLDQHPSHHRAAAREAALAAIHHA